MAAQAMKPTEQCVKTLDEMLLTDGQYNHEAALQRLKTQYLIGEIPSLVYLELLDAARWRNEAGDYVGCSAYQRALLEERGRLSNP